MRLVIVFSSLSLFAGPLLAESLEDATNRKILEEQQAYNSGFSDSQSYAEWWQSLNGDAKKGAFQGTLDASLLPPEMCIGKNVDGCRVIPCSTHVESSNPEWLWGCSLAQKHAAIAREGELSSPMYKRGEDASTKVLMDQERTQSGEDRLDKCIAATIQRTPSEIELNENVRNVLRQCNEELGKFMKYCKSGPNSNNCELAVELDVARIKKRSEN